MLRTLHLITALLLGLIAHGQQAASADMILPYLHGVRIKSALALNIRGFEVSVEKAAGKLSGKSYATLFKGFPLSRNAVETPDSSFGQPALLVTGIQEKEEEQVYTTAYIFAKTADTVMGIYIAGISKPDKAFVDSIVSLIVQNGIPDSLISDIDGRKSLLIAGRRIDVNNRCLWRGANTMQCSGFGEMNWSQHPNMAEAAEQTARQEARNKRLKRLEAEKEEQVAIHFESEAVTVKKIQYRVKGVAGFLSKRTEGSRTLIVYYVTVPVRGVFISCVLSYWTSDYLEPNGLPPLLNTVMTLQ